MQAARTLVSMEELAKLMTDEIRKFEDCKDCALTAYRLDEPDEDGCNWSMTDIVTGAVGVSPQTLAHAKGDVEARARKLYNLAEEDED